MKKKSIWRTVLFLFIVLLVGIVIHEIIYYLKPQENKEVEYSLEHMKTGNIAVQTGTTVEQFCLNEYPEAQISSFNNLTDTVPALLNGKVDYIVTLYTAELNYIREYPDELMMLSDELGSIPISMGFTKGEDELKEKVNQLIAAYQQDGTMDEIRSHWLNEEGGDYIVPQLDELADAPVLTVAISADDEPMDFVMDGQIVGFDSELIQRIAYDLGYRVEFMNANFTSVLAAVSSGKAQIAISNMTETPERAESIDFSVPYFENSTRIIVRKAAEVQEKQSILVRLGQDFKKLQENFTKNFLTESRWKLILSGLGVTIIIALFSALFGSLFGALLCFLRMKGNDIAQNLVLMLVRIVQGIPILVILMFLYFVVFKTAGISGIVIAIVAFSINFGVYVSEIIRSGIMAVNQQQYQAALALGYKPVKAFQRVVLPQAAIHFLPVYKGEFVSLFKSTSIVGYIAIQDLTKMSDIIRSRTYEAFFPLIITAVIYFGLSYICAIGIGMIQKKCSRGRA